MGLSVMLIIHSYSKDYNMQGSFNISEKKAVCLYFKLLFKINPAELALFNVCRGRGGSFKNVGSVEDVGGPAWVLHYCIIAAKYCY